MVDNNSESGKVYQDVAGYAIEIPGSVMTIEIAPDVQGRIYLWRRPRKREKKTSQLISRGRDQGFP